MQTEANRQALRRMWEESQQSGKPRDIQKVIDHLPNYQISIRVVSQKGTCLGGHKVGDEWLMKGRRDGWRTPSGICMFAYDVLSPVVQMMMFGGTYPWAFNEDVWQAPCPDPRNPVIFELRRLPEA